MSGPDPQETWRRLQRTLQNAQQQGRQRFGGGGFPGGNPRNLFGGVGALILLGGGALFVNNALFNGKSAPIYPMLELWL
jgi:prohibitin 2